MRRPPAPQNSSSPSERARHGGDDGREVGGANGRVHAADAITSSPADLADAGIAEADTVVVQLAAKSARENTRASAGNRGVDLTAEMHIEPNAGADAAPREPSPRASERRAARTRKKFERSEVRRFTASSRRRTRRWIVSVTTLGIFALLIVIAVFTPVFSVRTIEVDGISRIDRARLDEALNPQRGVPLALVDNGAVQRSLESFPLIESYSIERELPGTLRIAIVERTPIAWAQTDQVFTLVDAAGVVFEQVPTPNVPLPILEGGAAQLGSDSFRATARALTTLAPDFRATVARASAESPDSIRFALTTGEVVVWGSAEDSEVKAARLAQLIAATSDRGVSEYDVSAPDLVVIN